MKGILSCMALFLLASWQVSCRSEIADEGDQPIADSVPDGTGGDSDVVIGPPGDMAKITFFVDDRANKTFADGQMRWTGSFKWDVAANTIVYATSWLPTDGPFPLLYDDGPQSAGGHEMEGAEKGDNIFSIEVFYKAEKQDPTFQYGVLNELDFWMWTGPNGSFDIPKGSTATFNLQGLVLEAFGNVDLKLTVDVNGLAPDFADVP